MITIKDTRTLRDTLHNCSTENTTNERHKEYARGIIVATVATIMSVTGCNFEEAVQAIRPHIDYASFDYLVLPESWFHEFVKKEA
jgi:hypothetical protein